MIKWDGYGRRLSSGFWVYPGFNFSILAVKTGVQELGGVV